MFALVARHVSAPISFLDASFTTGALLCLPIDRGKRLVFLSHAILDTSLELFARLALVPGPVAWHTSLPATCDVYRTARCHRPCGSARSCI